MNRPAPESCCGRARALVRHRHLGRDIFARTMVGHAQLADRRRSIALATTVALGVLIGLYRRLFRFGDRVVMRVMDGLMAIPGVLLAVALVSLLGGGLVTVIIAITVPEIPRMARLVRSVTLTLQEQPFVTAASTVRRRQKSCSATSCPTPSAHSRSRRPMFARPRSSPRRSWASSASAPRPRCRAGATSSRSAGSISRSRRGSSSSPAFSCRPDPRDQYSRRSLRDGLDPRLAARRASDATRCNGPRHRVLRDRTVPDRAQPPGGLRRRRGRSGAWRQAKLARRCGEEDGLSATRVEHASTWVVAHRPLGEELKDREWCEVCASNLRVLHTVRPRSRGSP